MFTGSPRVGDYSKLGSRFLNRSTLEYFENATSLRVSSEIPSGPAKERSEKGYKMSE